MISSIDVLFVLGGEKEHERSNIARDVYNTLQRRPLVLSGSHSGSSKNGVFISEAQQMKNYLLTQQVVEKDIHLEEKSLDTLSNMVYSRPIIEQVTSDTKQKRVGLVTSDFHMRRSLWLANRVFPKTFEFIPHEASTKTNYQQRVKEVIIKLALQYDLWKESIESGNQEHFERFMKQMHPLYVDHAPAGFYKVLVNASSRPIATSVSRPYERK